LQQYYLSYHYQYSYGTNQLPSECKKTGGGDIDQILIYLTIGCVLILTSKLHFYIVCMCCGYIPLPHLYRLLINRNILNNLFVLLSPTKVYSENRDMMDFFLFFLTGAVGDGTTDTSRREASPPPTQEVRVGDTGGLVSFSFPRSCG